MTGSLEGTRALLLRRRRRVFVESNASNADTPRVAQALELELAELGFVASTRLSRRLAAASADELVALQVWLTTRLAATVGGGRPHVPLFRSFPEGIPVDTAKLWWTKVLLHYLQAEAQPCLFCGEKGTTHVLDPCRHVVCDRCFDGASYSACPVCEHQVGPSPFFQPAPARTTPAEQVVFTRLDLGEDLVGEARALFTSLCERVQPLTPDDRDALVTLLGDFRVRALEWLPAKIPVRENVAIVFGTLFGACPPDEVLPVAKRYLTSATDVLRFVAVFSGADAALAPTPRWVLVDGKPKHRSVRRFRVKPLSRALRRTLLAILEGMPFDRLAEDLLRHRSYWVWLGEFLHPHEYAARFPQVARAFALVRGQAPDGAKAPTFVGFGHRVERARLGGDVRAMVDVLAERPGELARRFDHLLRLAKDEGELEHVTRTFARLAPAFATPLLLTLRSHLPRRAAAAKVRVYFPKAAASTGVSAPDARPVLSRAAIEAALPVVDEELLRRFGQRPVVETFVLDAGLARIVVPFAARTASRSAVALPRGSRLPIPLGKLVRLFLHWCEPEERGRTTDLDLSVGFYDADFRYLHVCSYYELTAAGAEGVFAKSAGDLRSAPYPDGATEFVDVELEPTRREGIRYAVMVLNAYSGMTFGALERAFAGLMLRDDPGGHPFDPRTVQLKFELAGEHGVFVPVVLDVVDGVLHWLDVYSPGQLSLNNVATSNRAITRFGPALLEYFGSGVRPSLFELGALHAAARATRVHVRHPDRTSLFLRRGGETATQFLGRILGDAPDEPRSQPVRGEGPPVVALLEHGDLALPPGSAVYALFSEQVSPTLAASDLL